MQTARGAEVFNLALGRRDSKVSPAALTRHSHAPGGRCPDAASSGSPPPGPLGGEGQGERAGEGVAGDGSTDLACPPWMEEGQQENAGPNVPWRLDRFGTSGTLRSLGTGSLRLV